MATSGAFKVPNMIAQDLAIIMGLVDPPEATSAMREKRDSARGHEREGSPKIISRSTFYADNAISSGTESEDEVEELTAVHSEMNGAATTASIVSSVETSSSSEEDTDTSSASSSSGTSFRRRKRKAGHTLPSFTNVDANDDGNELPTPDTYLPTTNEMSLTAIPIPSLPDPASLPQEALEYVGEIVTVLPDSVTVRGGGLSMSSAKERRDTVLDEGSLLLLDDRTPLGHVWETFGPTTLPHYLVRLQANESTRRMITRPHTPTDAQYDQDRAVLANGNNIQPLTASDLPSTPPHDCLDPTKIFITRAIYHVPSLSKFVFPSALARLKGSDASNPHDEEPAEQELEFSDDEAERAYTRLRRGSFPRAPSQARFSGTFDDEAEDHLSTVDNEASSLYGASPYDFEDMRFPNGGKDGVPSSPGRCDSPAPSQSSINFQDADTQKALMLARNSRHRRRDSLSISEESFVAGSARSSGLVDQFHARGGRGGRGRGKGRGRSERGREPSFTAQSRGRGRRRGQGVDLERSDAGHSSSGQQRSSYSFEEYDPHMPRPPSPTSLAIARAIGQWEDGTPFPYNYSGGSTIGFDGHVGQTTNNIQGHMPMHLPPGPYHRDYFDPAVSLPQPLEYESAQLGSHGVTPHINPRFAQAIELPNSGQRSSATPPSTDIPPGSFSIT